MLYRSHSDVVYTLRIELHIGIVQRNVGRTPPSSNHPQPFQNKVFRVRAMGTLDTRRIRRFIWGDLPRTKVERRLLLKIDWFILSYCCLMVRLVTHNNIRTDVLRALHSTLRTVRRVLYLVTGRKSLNVGPRVDLDRSNISNAYVSGMKEELNMIGNQFNVRTPHFGPLGLRRRYLTAPVRSVTANQHDLHVRLHRRDDPE